MQLRSCKYWKKYNFLNGKGENGNSRGRLWGAGVVGGLLTDSE